MQTDEFVLSYLDKLEGRLVEIALAIWANPESGLNEFFLLPSCWRRS